MFGLEVTPEVLDAFLVGHRDKAVHQLTGEQEGAVRTALSHRFSLLLGGAGVGKTTTLRAIADGASHFGLDVCQLALAGRAVQRMASATGRPAQTIASWLARAGQGRASGGAHMLMIVDEASMLDLPTLYRLLFHLDEEARLVLVGDPAQLPPTGYGLTLHRLAESPRVPKTELTRVLRANDSTGIPLVSRSVRQGAAPALPRYSPGAPGCSFMECEMPGMVGALEAIMDDLSGEEVQIIAPTYGGPTGIDAINTHFHRFNAHGKARVGRFAPGDPVIWTQNDYDRGLWNGSMGAVLEVANGRLLASLDGREFAFEAGELVGRLDLAYAISTHKAQGSQWRTVILPILPCRLLDRALLYTAMTRAQERVVLVGSRELWGRTVQNPPVSLLRDVSLSL